MSNNLKLIILEDPFSTWENPVTMDLFYKIISLKKSGFGSRFSRNYSPVDKSDFHATHMCLAEELNGELKILSSFKAINKSTSDYYNMPFPGGTICDSTNSIRHINYLKSFVNECVSNQEDIVYYGTYALNPSLNRDQKKIVLSYIFPILGMYSNYWNINKSILVGSVKTKFNKIISRAGILPISENGIELSPVKIPILDNELFSVQVGFKFSELCFEFLEEHNNLWTDRIHISSEADSKLKAS